MATTTINMSHGGTSGFPAREYLKTVGVITKYLDLSKAASIRGSALTAGDEIKVIQLPAGCLVLGGSAEVVTAANVASSYSVGLSGGSLNTLVDAGPLSVAGVTAQGTNGSTAWHYQTPSGGAIISFKLQAAGTTVTSGIVRIDVVVAHTGADNAANQS